MSKQSTQNKATWTRGEHRSSHIQGIQVRSRETCAGCNNHSKIKKCLLCDVQTCSFVAGCGSCTAKYRWTCSCITTTRLNKWGPLLITVHFQPTAAASQPFSSSHFSRGLEEKVPLSVKGFLARFIQFGNLHNIHP